MQGTVRILVVGPGAAGGDLGTRAALERLGPGARIEQLAEVEAALASIRAGGVDLVVAERGPDSPCDALLDGLGGAGPPVVVVCPGGENEALDAFRRGAADCVVPGAASPLAEVVLEQLSRWRALRQHASLEELQSEILQREKMASIGQLAAGVAHEINNPIGFIHANLAQMAEYVADLRRAWGGVEALQKAVGSGARDEVERAADQLAALCDELDVAFVLGDLGKAVRESREGSERVRHIVQDLKEFSHRGGDGAEATDLNQCLDSTLQIVWPMMKHLVVVEKDYEELPAIQGYPMLLKQVFVNLLVNAYQAIEQRIGDGGETGRVRLATRCVPEGIAVSVSDDGVGIAEEHRARIFDPFFTTKRVGAGTGLGLSISFQIVQRHGGVIRVESQPGQGTTFELVLPLVAAPEAQ